MKTRVKSEKLGALIKKLDVQVSLFVRLNAADQNGTVRCISCWEKMYFTDADCAHYEDRDNMATRFYLPNLAPACQNCNRFDHYNHLAAWKDKMSDALILDLEKKAHSFEKFTRPELEEKIEYFTEEVKRLRKIKGL